CKSLLSISAGNIDSRSGVNTQQRFKRTDVLIRLFQTSISQSPLGDFCNTIGQKRSFPRRYIIVEVISARRRHAKVCDLQCPLDGAKYAEFFAAAAAAEVTGVSWDSR